MVCTDTIFEATPLGSVLFLCGPTGADCIWGNVIRAVVLLHGPCRVDFILAWSTQIQTVLEATLLGSILFFLVWSVHHCMDTDCTWGNMHHVFEAMCAPTVWIQTVLGQCVHHFYGYRLLEATRALLYGYRQYLRQNMHHLYEYRLFLRQHPPFVWIQTVLVATCAPCVWIQTAGGNVHHLYGYRLY